MYISFPACASNVVSKRWGGRSECQVKSMVSTPASSTVTVSFRRFSETKDTSSSSSSPASKSVRERSRLTRSTFTLRVASSRSYLMLAAVLIRRGRKMYLLALQELPHLIWSQRVDVSVLERNWARTAWNDQKPLECILKYVRRIEHEGQARLAVDIIKGIVGSSRHWLGLAQTAGPVSIRSDFAILIGLTLQCVSKHAPSMLFPGLYPLRRALRSSASPTETA
jgi:hypothetical protein